MKKREGIYLTNVSVTFLKNQSHPVDGTKFDLLKISRGGKKTIAFKADEAILQTIAYSIQKL